MFFLVYIFFFLFQTLITHRLNYLRSHWGVFFKSLCTSVSMVSLAIFFYSSYLCNGELLGPSKAHFFQTCSLFLEVLFVSFKFIIAVLKSLFAHFIISGTCDLGVSSDDWFPSGLHVLEYFIGCWGDCEYLVLCRPWRADVCFSRKLSSLRISSVLLGLLWTFVKAGLELFLL